MRIFEGSGKTNYVDANDVYVGFCSSQSCCESFGHYFTREEPTLHRDENDEDSEHFRAVEVSAEELEPFAFVVDYFKSDDYGWGGGAAAFKLTNGAEEIYLVLYNHHNGYYSHGFEVKVSGEQVREGGL